jgi:Eukaryotic aspartyl protease
MSSSYRENGTAVEIHHTGYYTSGFACIDTLRIGNISISNQTFEEATIMKPTYFFDEPYDSVIGLSRLQVNYEESSLRAKSVFRNMIEQGLLA